MDTEQQPPTAAGHAPAAKASTRDRLLDTASALFYRQGVNTGIDTLCKAAGVSKRSMYQLFEGKDDMLAAALERSAAGYQALVLPPPDGPGAPVPGCCTSSGSWRRPRSRPTTAAAPSWPPRSS